MKLLTHLIYLLGYIYNIEQIIFKLLIFKNKFLIIYHIYYFIK